MVIPISEKIVQFSLFQIVVYYLYYSENIILVIFTLSSNL